MASSSRKSSSKSNTAPPKVVPPLNADNVAADSANQADAPEIVDTSGLEQVSQSAYRAQIEEAAYYRAERRGFSPGYEHEDWLEAEREIREQQSKQAANFPS
jgi:hypothetical protein